MFTECRAFFWRPLALCAAGAAQAEQKQKKKKLQGDKAPPTPAVPGRLIHTQDGPFNQQTICS